MNPRIEILQPKKIVGKRITMSFSNNQTFELWKSLMSRRKEIKNKLNADLISMKVYDTSYNFINFDLNATFEKWAAVEVSDFEEIPNEMETYLLQGGLYAIFLHKSSNTDDKTFRYIFETWLPASTEYQLDNRPHFEILGEKYKNDDPDSEEEIWIPIKRRK